MKIRKTISLEKEDFNALKPIIDKNNGNFSKALRGLIQSTIRRTGLKDLKKPLTPDDVWDKRGELRNELIDEMLGHLLPFDLMTWFITLGKGMVPPIGVYTATMERIFPDILGVDMDIGTFSRYVNPFLNAIGSTSNFQITYDDPKKPTWVKNRITMERAGGAETPAMMGSLWMAHSPLKLKPIKVTRTSSYLEIDYLPVETEEEAWEGVVQFFGHNQNIYDKLVMDPEGLWNYCEVAELCHGSVVTVGQDEFLKILKGEDPTERIVYLCEKVLGDSLSVVSMEELLEALERVGRITGLARKVETEGDHVMVHFTFSDMEGSRKMAAYMANIMKEAGHDFSVKKVFDDWCILEARRD